ncbi:MAG: RNA methyltransferase, partial [Alphaproteobacteria bacterium]|nr:RNA methyltransferase [Alphaproteobacteria bacterium]
FDARTAGAQWATEGGTDRRPLLLLDGVGNPQNLGAIARTAAFFGLPRLVLSDHPGQALPSDAAYRISEGGLEHMDVYRSAGFARDLRALREHYLVVGTAAQGGGAWPAALGGPAHAGDQRPGALVLGNEEQGLPRATLAACEAVVTIPGGGAVQSLNVAATAAILLHAAVWRRR